MSVQDSTTLRQCLSLLPLEDFLAPCLDYGVRKLQSVVLMKIFIAAQLCGWDTLRRIEAEIEADEMLQQEFGCTISASQLSRRINHFPTDVLEALFHSLGSRIMQLAAKQKKLPKEPLYAVDSTHIRLPFQLADWAHFSRKSCGVKVHTRLAILSGGACIPDRVVPSTGNVSDYEGSDLLVVEPDATYIMDRGYVSYRRMDRWLMQQSRFVIRINHHHLIKQVLEAYRTDLQDPNLLSDAIVYLGGTFRWMEHPVRVVEFRDETGRVYRIATSRFDLTAREVADLYRQRWQVELFFKWMKQHLKFAKLYSHQPEAVWNHILLAMIAYSLVFLLRMQTQGSKTTWQTLQLVRVYAFRNWTSFLKVLNKQPTGKTKGRRPSKESLPSRRPEKSDVAVVKVSKKHKRK